MEETKFVGVSGIQKKYLPASKKVIRKLLTENLNVIRNGNRILVDGGSCLNFWIRLRLRAVKQDDGQVRGKCALAYLPCCLRTS